MYTHEVIVVATRLNIHLNGTVVCKKDLIIGKNRNGKGTHAAPMRILPSMASKFRSSAK